MRGTPSARELAALLGLYRTGREWRGNCPSCGYSDTSRRLSPAPRSRASAVSRRASTSRLNKHCQSGVDARSGPQLKPRMPTQPREEADASARPAIIMPRAGAVRLQFQPSAPE
jgi:hypothetical protein